MTDVTCVCGAVCIETTGTPILGAVCHCNSCRTAGRELDIRSKAAPIVDASGGTAVVLWRKDRLKCVRGADLLQAHRLNPESPTRRMVASCCGTPMFTDFTKGFWLTIYRDRLPDAPPPSVRVMTGDVPEGMSIPDDGLPHARGHSGRFMLKLLATWAAMGFRNPKVAGVSD
ncbi:hypothetical protein LGH82_10015 [Mesorhizobium sp. PAMC28654]|uniref:GFA family protein n=1 Tax=Mesorhizobium sp. PAMC28654 TaxID=2880934 RepID=UPI001D0B121B|nr:hypothetical protein [Mesorhizobium sp. PAMC28654]UDL91539.1 hypothetical protein LGH82_10015 [Mesorhizobium sp. PAMC28654]